VDIMLDAAPPAIIRLIRMRSFFQTVLLVLVLLLVALVSALTAMRLAIHTREVSVPKLVGLTPLEAERATSSLGLPVMVERQYYSATVPEGKIMSQLPEPGSQVRRGWQVRVAESLGPQRVAIPGVLGQSGRAAQINIRRHSLDLGAFAEVAIPGTPADQVVSQSPPANASGVSTPRIALLVTAAAPPPAFVMPSFVGQPLGSVTQTLQNAGMRLGTVTVVTKESPSAANPATAEPASPIISPAQAPAPALASPASIIVAQTPAGGQKITAGSTINFDVQP
jgi:beta-lactam-binding protein with PASTA domain